MMSMSIFYSRNFNFESIFGELALDEQQIYKTVKDANNITEHKMYNPNCQTFHQ